MTKRPKGNPSDWIRRAVGVGDTVIDGGANMGGFTKAAAETVGPTGKVFAVEPDPRCADTLRAIEKQYPQVVFVPAALVAQAGAVILQQAVKSEQSSLLERAVKDRLGEVEVEGVTLDSLTRGPVAAVKLDLQGSEPVAVLAAGDLLTRCPQWCVEIWPYALGKRADFLLWAFLGLDFTPRWMDAELSRADIDELKAWALAEHEINKHLNIVFTHA